MKWNTDSLHWNTDSPHWNIDVPSSPPIYVEEIPLSEIKAEAYKEFAEKLKKELLAYRKKCQITLDDESVFVVDKLRQMIDNLLKELCGE